MAVQLPPKLPPNLVQSGHICSTSLKLNECLQQTGNADNILREKVFALAFWCIFVKILLTMQDTNCYINNGEPCHQIDVDRYITTKTNTDFEAPPHILNSGRLSPR